MKDVVEKYHLSYNVLFINSSNIYLNNCSMQKSWLRAMWCILAFMPIQGTAIPHFRES